MDIDRWRSRLPVRRASDGEIIGWTVSSDGDPYSERVDAVNPVGQVVAAGVDTADATDILAARGLASLTEPCWARAPIPITRDTDFTRPQPDWRWRRVAMTQLDDNEVWIRAAYPHHIERFTEVPLRLPADDILHHHPPTTDE
ncbi:hypothetical protein [Williamsia sp. CHRR-6]|uniref:hypothetical protein n=1 Tax=Williamsia sp. CHRR-6 TaxID=2835871 RepID=UPI001BDAB1C8|nr:hypothetical protein [Williamsia sp. CHRR-6]MBT0566684.1 hypothetical protein [Williamsia sp. CHRR-6]